MLIAASSSDADLDSLVARRAAGEPLEPLLGWVEFAGLRLEIDPGVFVPRRRSEALAAAAIARTGRGDVVVDLCCGCGALGAAIATAVPGIELHAADLDPVAVACARRNLEPRGGAVWQGDLFAALPDRLRGRVAVLVVNAPYVPTDAIALLPPEARDHEPLMTLDGGPDGLDVHRRIADRARAPGCVPAAACSSRSPTSRSSAATAMLTAAGLEPEILPRSTTRTARPPRPWRSAPGHPENDEGRPRNPGAAFDECC